MKKFSKSFILGTAAFALGLITLTSLNVEARQDPDYNQNYGYQGGDDQGSNEQNYNQGGDDQGYNNQNYNQDGDDQGSNEQQAPAGPSVNVSVQMNVDGEYGRMFKREQDKFQVFMRALDNPKNSTKGSKPVRLSINGGDATFEGMEQDPKGLLVAISKEGSSYQYFCSGKNVKDGVIQGFPGQITVILKDGNKPYKTAAGTLRNDSYPNCEVQF